MTLLELLFTLTSALIGSAVFQYFLAKSIKKDVDSNVMLKTGGTLLGIVGAFALLTHFLPSEGEIRRVVSIGISVVIIMLFHRARLKLKKAQQPSEQ